jgi:uncharacterized membrane protein (UPF0136 family)
MSPANLFQMETATLLASKRSLCIKLIFPLLLGLPFVLVAMPLKARLAGLMILVVMVAFFGSSVAFVRCRREGRLDFLRTLPVSMTRIMADLLLAGTVVDLMQVGSVLILFLLVHASALTLEGLVTIAGLLLAALLLLNALGMALGYAVKENSEIHLAGGLVSGAVIFISGILPLPASVRKLIEPAVTCNPLFLLAENLRGLVEGSRMEADATFFLSALLLCVLASACILRAVDRQRFPARRS